MVTCENCRATMVSKGVEDTRFFDRHLPIFVTVRVSRFECPSCGEHGVDRGSVERAEKAMNEKRREYFQSHVDEAKRLSVKIKAMTADEIVQAAERGMELAAAEPGALDAIDRLAMDTRISGQPRDITMSAALFARVGKSDDDAIALAVAGEVRFQTVRASVAGRMQAPPKTVQ